MTISQTWSFQGSFLVLSLTGFPVPSSLWLCVGHPLCAHGTLLCHGCVCHRQRLLEKALLPCPFNTAMATSPSQALEQGTMSDKNPEITPRFSLPKLNFFHDNATNPPASKPWGAAEIRATISLKRLGQISILPWNSR